jgi:hypothetical protein
LFEKNGMDMITAYGGGGGGGTQVNDIGECACVFPGGGGGGGAGGRGGYATCATPGNYGQGGKGYESLPGGGDGANTIVEDSCDYYGDSNPPNNMQAQGGTYYAGNGFAFASGGGGGGLDGTDGGSVGLMRGGRGNGSPESHGGGGGGASAMSRGDDAAGDYYSIGSGGGGATSNDAEACGKAGGDGAVQIYGYR